MSFPSALGLGELQRAWGEPSVPHLFQTRGLHLVNIQPSFDSDPVRFVGFVFGGGGFALCAAGEAEVPELCLSLPCRLVFTNLLCLQGPLKMGLLCLQAAILGESLLGPSHEISLFQLSRAAVGDPGGRRAWAQASPGRRGWHPFLPFPLCPDQRSLLRE